MNSSQRGLDRDFSYGEFNTLINRIGLRDVAPSPEPIPYLMRPLGLLALGWRVQGARRSH